MGQPLHDKLSVSFEHFVNGRQDKYRINLTFRQTYI